LFLTGRGKGFLDRKAGDEVMWLSRSHCAEMRTHYFVGPKGLSGGKLTEAIRDRAMTILEPRSFGPMRMSARK